MTHLCFCFQTISLVNINGFSPNLVCPLILWRSALRLLIFDRGICLHPYFSFRTITWVNLNGFSPNSICALILWRSGFGLPIDKFRQFLTELSARDIIIAGYYRFMFFICCCCYVTSACCHIMIVLFAMFLLSFHDYCLMLLRSKIRLQYSVVAKNFLSVIWIPVIS